MAAAERPPEGLKTSGRRLWSAITRDYELSVHEMSLLLQAARTADVLDELQREIEAGGAIVDSSQGAKANPALVEARQQRIALARLLAALRIPTDQDVGSGKGRGQRRGVRGVYNLRPAGVS
jgi:hypothetical protein